MAELDHPCFTVKRWKERSLSASPDQLAQLGDEVKDPQQIRGDGDEGGPGHLVPDPVGLVRVTWGKLRPRGGSARFSALWPQRRHGLVSRLQSRNAHWQDGKTVLNVDEGTTASTTVIP